MRHPVNGPEVHLCSPWKHPWRCSWGCPRRDAPSFTDRAPPSRVWYFHFDVPHRDM